MSEEAVQTCGASLGYAGRGPDAVQIQCGLPVGHSGECGPSILKDNPRTPPDNHTEGDAEPNEKETPMFHAKEGWFFSRINDDGAVLIQKRKDAKLDGEVEAEVILDADSWGSVVASMTVTGEDGPKWRLAKAVHES